MSTNQVQRSTHVTVTAPRTVTSGEGVLVGASLFGVAQDAATSGATDLVIDVGGAGEVYELAKQAGLAVTAGDIVYWDNVNFECDADTSNVAIGTAAATAAGGASVVSVYLNGHKAVGPGLVNVDSEQVNIAILPNGATTEIMLAPADMTVSEIGFFADTAPVSAAGTFLCAITGGGSNLLNAATFDLESLADDTYATATLTATTANLTLSANDAIVITSTSDNVDLTGAGLVCIVKYSHV